MNTVNQELTNKRADEVYKILAAVGFLLNSFSSLEFYSDGKQRVFSMGLKYTTQKFKAELEKAERIFTHGDFQTNELMMQQMADSYQVIDNIVSLMLEGGRVLSPDEMKRFNEEMVATAAKWNVKLAAAH